VKAQGGFVVAPPSVRMTGKNAGKPYVFERGSWNDLARLQPIKPRSLAPRVTLATDCPTPSAATRRPHLVQGGTDGDIGRRNNLLFEAAMRRAPSCSTEADLLAVGIAINNRFNPPLDFAEVAKVVGQAWRYETRGENRLGRSSGGGGKGPPGILANYPDAATLHAILKHANGARAARDELFAASPDAMARDRVIDAWGNSPRRYRRALATLVELGLLHIMHRGGRHRGDARKFSFGEPPMTPRLIVSNAPRDADLFRVVDALGSGLSIRKAGETLGLDKSKVLRLKHRAEASGLLGSAVSDPPDEVSHCLTDEVSHFVVGNVRSTPPAGAPLPRKEPLRENSVSADSEGGEGGTGLAVAPFEERKEGYQVTPTISTPPASGAGSESAGDPTPSTPAFALAGAVYRDAAGRLIHYCHCGAWGAYGFGSVGGSLGKWYCADHRPEPDHPHGKLM